MCHCQARGLPVVKGRALEGRGLKRDSVHYASSASSMTKSSRFISNIKDPATKIAAGSFFKHKHYASSNTSAL